MRRPLWFVLMQEPGRPEPPDGSRPLRDPVIHDMTRSKARAELTYTELRELYEPGEARVWIAREVPAPKKRRGGRKK